MKEIKILMIIDSMLAGGTERRLLETLKGFKKDNQFKFQIIILNENIFYKELYKLNIPLHFFKRRIKKDPAIFFKIFRLCKKYKPDIIHSWSSMSSIYAMPAAKILGIKFINGMIIDAQKIKFLSSAWMRSKLTFHFSDVIVGNSNAGMNAYKAPRKKSITIHNGFDFSRVQNLNFKEKIKKKFDITTSKIAGMVANFSRFKDTQTFLMAAQNIIAQKSDITFILVGDISRISEKEKDLALANSDKIKLLGSQEEIESIINIFDIGILTTYTEGFSNVIMEYMALGKPVIATDCAGTREIIVNNETGFLIPRGSIEELIEKILYLLDNPDKGIEMGWQGERSIKKNFNITKMINSYKELYIQLCRHQ